MKNQYISPHVTIYKFPITALSSISTRLSGLYLSGLFVGYGVTQMMGIDLYNKYSKLKGVKKSAVDYSLLVPGTYHTFSGMRHFVWDRYPSLLNNKHVARSSYFLFGITLGTSIVTERYLNFNTDI